MISDWFVKKISQGVLWNELGHVVVFVVGVQKVSMSVASTQTDAFNSIIL